MIKLFKIGLLIFVTFPIACNKVDSFGKFSIYQKIDDSSTLILTIKGDDRSYTFNSNIKLDLRTLISYREFLVDKNWAYKKYEISDACIIIPLEQVDIATFHVLGNSIYAKDKNHVYDSRNGILPNADANSFEAIEISKNSGYVTGKDKYHYYFWEKEIEDTLGFSRKYSIINQK